MDFQWFDDLAAVQVTGHFSLDAQKNEPHWFQQGNRNRSIWILISQGNYFLKLLKNSPSFPFK